MSRRQAQAQVGGKNVDPESLHEESDKEDLKERQPGLAKGLLKVLPWVLALVFFLLFFHQAATNPGSSKSSSQLQKWRKSPTTTTESATSPASVPPNRRSRASTTTSTTSKVQPTFSSNPSIQDVIQHNRRVLKDVPRWSSPSLFENSVMSYGINAAFWEEFDKDLGPDPTVADAIAYMARNYHDDGKVKYLELGVSLGKTFFQVFRALDSPSVAQAFEIEDINPALESRLRKIGTSQNWRAEISGGGQSPRGVDRRPTLTEYRCPQNEVVVKYMAADLDDLAAWNKLKGMKYDFIFSDASHGFGTLTAEYEKLSRLELIGTDKLTIFYDDLQDATGQLLESEVVRIFEDLSQKFGPDRPLYFATLWINGWTGANAEQHRIGIISTVNLSEEPFLSPLLEKGSFRDSSQSRK